MPTRSLFLATAVLTVAGCSFPPPKYHYDQDLRRAVFEKCLTTVPAGPQSTKYNDWDEVVDACASAAVSISLRDETHVGDESSVEK